MPLHRFGDVTVNGVPFFVMDPAKSLNGHQPDRAEGRARRPAMPRTTFAQRVEIPTGAVAASLHFLGGVGVWAWPVGGDAARGTPVMKVVVQFADGTAEEHVPRERPAVRRRAGARRRADERDAGDFTGRGQLRYFAINLGKKGALSKIVLESYDGDVVPVTVAITAGDEPVAARAQRRRRGAQAARRRSAPRAPAQDTGTEGRRQG